MNPSDEIIAIERAALDRWGNGDPGGYLDLYAPEVSYFDPLTDARVEGHRRMADYYAPFAGKIFISRFEMLNPEVVVDGNMAVLSYNLVNYTNAAKGAESVGSRWNATVVFQRQGGSWKSVHVHWSFTAHPAFQNLTVQSSEQTG